MKLRRIDLMHFRSHLRTEIDDLVDVNWFGGYNGVGKSSIADAIAVGLCGTVWGYEGGQHLDELRATHGNDEDRWSVRLLHEAGSIERREGEGPKSQAQRRVEQLVGLAPETIRTVLYSGELMRLLRSGEYKRLRSMLMGLAGDRRVAIDEEHRQTLRDAILPDPEDVNAEDLEQLYKQAYAERTKVGRMARAGGRTKPPDLPEILREADIPEDVEGLRETGIAVRRQLDELQAGLRDRHGERARAEGSIDQLRRELSELDDRIATEQKRIDDLPMDRKAIADRVKSMAGDMRQAEKTGKAIESKIADLNDRLGAATAEERAHKRRIEAARGLGDKCPECAQKVSKTAKLRLEKNRRGELEVAQRQRQEIEMELGELRKSREELPDRVEIAGQIAKLERAQQLLIESEQSLKKLKASRTGAAKRLKDAEQLVEQDQGDDDEDEIRERISKGEKVYSALMEYAGALSEFQSSKSAADAKKRHERVDALVAHLDDLKAQLASGDEVREVLTGVERDLDNLGFKARLSPLLSLEEPVVNGRRARLLSVSEQLRLGIAVQIALAAWSELGLVLVDQWELLDHEVASACMDLLEGSEQQVFIFGKVRDLDAFIEVGKGCDAGTAFYAIEKDDAGDSIVTRVKRQVTA